MFCIFKVPCHCSFNADNFNFAMRITHCKQQITEATKVYPVNLGLLHRFFSAEDLSNIKADTSFNTPLKIKIPPFKLFNHKFQKDIAVDQKFHLNLDLMASKAKQDKIIYQTLSDPMLNGEWSPLNTDSDWLTKPSFIVISISILLSVVSAILSIVLAIKYRNLSAAIFIAKSGNTCAAFTIDTPKPLIWEKPVPTTTILTPVTTSSNSLLPFLNSSYFSIIGIALFSFLILRYLYRCKFNKKNHKTKFHIELTNGKDCVVIDVMSLPMCPQNWILKGNKYIDDFILDGKLIVSLHLNWHDIILKNKNTDQTFPLPKVFKIDPMTALKLRKILGTTFNAYLLFTHTGISQYTDITPHDNDIIVTDSAPKIYPELN